MNSYIERFQFVMGRSTRLYGADTNPALLLDITRPPYDDAVVAAVVSDFKDGVVDRASALPGNCFAIVREASYVLFEMGIDNAVTIGTVSANGRPHFSTTQSSVDRDMSSGFIPNSLANSHAWLTLDSGQILDPTILPSWAYHDEGREIELEDAIYLSGLRSEVKLEHDPFQTGFAYHLHVVSHPFAVESFQRYLDWLKHATIFKRKIARQRDTQPFAAAGGYAGR